MDLFLGGDHTEENLKARALLTHATLHYLGLIYHAFSYDGYKYFFHFFFFLLKSK